MSARPNDDDLELWLLIASETKNYPRAPEVKVLVGEVRRLRSLLDRAYPLLVDQPGTEGVQAELELEVLAIREEARRKAAH